MKPSRRARSDIEEVIKGIFLLKPPSRFKNSEPIEESPERPPPSRGDMSYNFFLRGGRKDSNMGEKKNWKVKTFTTELKIFQTIKELEALDDKVNRFIAENKVKKIISVSDTTTTDNAGATIGVIRVLTYEA